MVVIHLYDIKNKKDFYLNFDSPYLFEKFLRKVQKSKKLQILSYGKVA